VSGYAIELDRVDFSYGYVQVIVNASLRVTESEFVYVIGPNGGGKTTLLKLIVGLLKPQSGAVRVFGMEPEKARSRIGYVAQQSSHDLSVPMTVREVVLMGRLTADRIGGYTTSDLLAADRALERLGMSELSDWQFADLSGGQKQRVLIARALAGEPDLLLLDEPTANIDPAAREDIIGLLEHLRQEITILMVSHDVWFVPEGVTKVVCVDKTVAVHPTSEVTAEAVYQMYGKRARLIRHDRLSEEVVRGGV
jgi:zinc transport system ATP-binding protein